MTAAPRCRSQRTSSQVLYAAIPPETPTSTTRSARAAWGTATLAAPRLAEPLARPPRSRPARSASGRVPALLDAFLVGIRHLVANRALERERGHLALDRLGGAARPLVQ